jgi:hypothetical protein
MPKSLGSRGQSMESEQEYERVYRLTKFSKLKNKLNSRHRTTKSIAYMCFLSFFPQLQKETPWKLIQEINKRSFLWYRTIKIAH